MIRIVSFGIALMALLASAADEVVIESPMMRIRFADADGGYAISRIENRLVEDTPFVGTFGKELGFWAVKFCRGMSATNVYAWITSTNASEKTVEMLPGGGARFCWKNLSLPHDARCVDVAAEVGFAPDGASNWKISLVNRSRVWTQHTVDYPILRGIMPEKEGDALMPWKNLGGQLFRNFDSRLADQHREFNVPGAFLPLAAFMRGEAGLYVAAQDGEMRFKRMRVDPGSCIRFSTVLEDAGVNGKAAEGPRYAVTVAAFKGDWWDAAHRYRDWALNQKWCRKGKIAYRKDFPKIAAESDLWPNGGGVATNMSKRFRQMLARWPDVQLASSWAGWYMTQPHNRMNPEFFPMRDPAMPDAAREARKLGIHLMPYLNGRIWDKSAAGFAYAKADATVDEDGRLYDERYVSDHFAVMCPWCPTWQSVVRNLGVRVLDEFGADMAYFDQVSVSRTRPCFNPAHGHPLGGGTWWAEGYRTMFEAIHADFEKRGAAVTSEQLGEAWLDVIDAYLNASEMTTRDVPLFPAVYQGYCIHFGRSVGCGKPHQTHAWRFLQDAKTVLWGEAPGWIGPHIYILPTYFDEAENLRTVAKFRREQADFLVYGSLENEVRFEGDDPEVYGTVWKDASGKRTAAAFVNAGASEKRIRYRYPGESVLRDAVLPPMELKLLVKE